MRSKETIQVEQRFREYGTVKDLPQSGRSKLNDEMKFYVLLKLEQNPQTATRVVDGDNDVSKTSNLRIMEQINTIHINFNYL